MAKQNLPYLPKTPQTRPMNTNSARKTRQERKKNKLRTRESRETKHPSKLLLGPFCPNETKATYILPVKLFPPQPYSIVSLSSFSQKADVVRPTFKLTGILNSRTKSLRFAPTHTVRHFRVKQNPENLLRKNTFPSLAQEHLKYAKAYEGRSRSLRGTETPDPKNISRAHTRTISRAPLHLTKQTSTDKKKGTKKRARTEGESRCEKEKVLQVYRVKGVHKYLDNLLHQLGRLHAEHAVDIVLHVNANLGHS